jgi:hypothetical protein
MLLKARIEEADAFDPRTWTHDLPYRPIWLDPEAGMFAVVDLIDYEWALSMCPWKAIPNSTRKLWYAAKSIRVGAKVATLYMHIGILARKEPRISSRHRMGDHRSSQSLDNRRLNLRWATPRLNSLNRRGSHAEYEGDC